jgi:lactose/cellobiose-specific phosphotransferase system IIC component
VGIFKRVHLWLIAIKDSFITLLPVTFLGVVAILLKDFPLPVYQSMMTGYWGPTWQEHLQLIVDATHGLFGMTLCVLVSIQIANRLKRPGGEKLPHLLVGISGLTNFMILAAAQGTLTPHSLGHDSILTAIGVGIFSAEALRWAAATRWLNPLRMPYDTDPIFYHSLRLTTPFIAIGLAVAAAAFGFALLPTIEASPLRYLIEMAQNHGGSAWWLSSIAVLINQVVWFLGSHGSHFLDAYATSLFSPWGMPYDSTLASRPLFNTFVLIGGSGATFGLLLAIAIAAREGPARKVAQLSILPGIFNINETILYGLPVVLNPIFLLPFIALPLLLNLLTLVVVNLGFMEILPVTIPWTTPPIISGWMLTGSWHGAAFQVVEIALSAALYLPFVRRAEAGRIHEQSRKLAETTDAILAEGRARLPVVRRSDQIGLMARGLLSDLRADLAGNMLKLAYQPKHALDGRVVGVEALLRWHHRRYGDLPPAMAISLAEDSGDIHKLGRWMLEQACACKARWNRQGFNRISMAVNVSPLQLTDHAFVPRLADILKKHGLDPDDIELEITESLHIPDTLVVDAALRDLSELGIRLAMDDFGMGYTSLLHIRRFRVHAIKIDGSLTRDILSNTASADIIRTIAELGRAQDIDVIAEFVETQAQRDLLVELGCDCFQGHFHSPALGEAECLEYFRIHRQELPGAEYSLV